MLSILNRKQTLVKVMCVFGVLILLLGNAVNSGLAQDLHSDAVVLVNSASPSFTDFEEYIQPYLDHYGVPYSVIDIASEPIGSEIGDFALIIIGHQELDTPLAYLSTAEQDAISAAVGAGTGLVNFDNDLGVSGSPRYDFVDDVYGFSYGTPGTGSGVTFTSESGGGVQINCWEDAHQDPVLTTFTNAGLFNDTDGAWDEFLWVGHRDYPGVFAGIPEASGDTLETFHCFGEVPNGTYDVIANLYHSRDWRYTWGYSAAAPRTNSYDMTEGPAGDFAEIEIDTVTITDGSFDIYMNYGEDLGGTSFEYFGWSWIRLVPTTAPPPVMHYITERHAAGETISTGSMGMAGISLPGDVTALAMTGTQPFLAVTEHGLGNAVQWGSYDWMSHSVKGPVYALDDLVWRSIVWAARKPFVMQGLPNFVTMRVDDESGPFGWIEIANEFGIKPWAGLFYYNVDATEAAQLSSLVLSGDATASVHAKTGSFFYYDHGTGDFPDAEIAANYAHATTWHADHNIPISKFVLPHYYEFGTNVFQGLSDWGVEFVGTMMVPGTGYGTSWVMNGPFRLYETGGSSAGRPVTYADFLSVPGHPEFDGEFFNCVTEIRDDAGYEWYPSNDVATSIGRGTRQTVRALNNMQLSTLFTHGQHVSGITAENWRAILQGITDNLAPYDPVYVTMDHACQYVRAMYTSSIASSVYDPESGEVTTSFEGESDMPTMFYLFTEQGGDIHHVLVDVPAFSAPTEVAHILAGPLDHVVVTPDPVTMATGGMQQFSAMGYDSEDNPIPNLPFTWSVVAGGGTIDAGGMFTAGMSAGLFSNTVEASFGGIAGHASVDIIAPVLDHFTFEAISSPQYAGAPFQITIDARDISNNLLLGYSGPAALSDSTGTMDLSATGSFSGGSWTGEVVIGAAAHDVIITANDGAASGSSAPFEVMETPMFYQVTSPAYEHYAGDSFLVTVTAYEGTTINCWEDAHQDPVLTTTTDWTLLETTPGEWTEFHYVSGRPFPSVMAAHNEYEDYGLPLMRFFASGIPNGSYEVIANLYESSPMRYFYGFTPGDPFAHYVDTPGGAPGTQHREYSLGTVAVTDGTFNLYVQDADILGGTYPIFGWAWVRLVPVSTSDIVINLWEDAHQDPTLVPFGDPGLLNDHDGLWDEFDYASRDYPSVMAGHNEWEDNGLSPMHFYADGLPNGTYDVWANLYTGRQTRHYYGFTEGEALAESRWVDNVAGAGGSNQHDEYLLGEIEITDGSFDLWAGDGDSASPYFYGWAWIRLVPAGLTMSSDSPTMLFDGDEDGIFGEPGDNVKPLVGGTFDIMARDITPGADVEIRATDVLGQFGYNLYTILSVNEPPVADAGGPYDYVSEGTPVTVNGFGSTDPDDNIVMYEWDLDNDGEFDDASGITAVVTFHDNGVYTVGLRVTDEYQESDTDTAQVFVSNVAPTATFNAPAAVDEGDDINLSLTSPFDPSSDDAAAGFEYAFDCGDGGGYGAFSGTSTAVCPTTDQGSRSVGGKIRDKDGGESEYTAALTVNNVAPTATFNAPASVDEGTGINLSLTAPIDPSSADTAAGFEYAFDCGDGGGYGAFSGTSTAVCPTTDQGSRSVGGRIRDKDGGESEYIAAVTVNNVAPTATFNAPASVDEGADINLSLTAAYDPSSADTAAGFAYAFDCGDGSGYGAFSGSSSAVCPTTDQGSRDVGGKIRDKDGGETEYTSTVIVNNVAPAVSAAPESQSVQYSDSILEVTFTATDVAADSLGASVMWSVDGGGSTPGLPLSLNWNDDGCTINGSIVCSWRVSGIVNVPAGAYTIQVTVSDEDGGSTVKEIAIIVAAEDASVGFATGNPVGVPVVEDGGDSGPFSLAVNVRETSPDEPAASAHPGDISLAVVHMNLVPVGPGSTVVGDCLPGAVASGILPVACSFDDVEVNTYSVEVVVDGGYYDGYGEDVVVIYDPSLGFTTGGGWFYWPGTDEKTNFGFTMKYNKKGTNVKGSFLLIRHVDEGLIYRVKSNALYGLALGSESGFGWASFSGKATYLEPGELEPIGNHEFLVYVEDWGESDSDGDQIWLEIRGKDGEVIAELSMPRPTVDNTEPLEGGNLVVPH